MLLDVQSNGDAVVSEACHFPEIAEVGAGRVVPLDAAAVAAALREVLADAALQRAMGAAGRALVEERFTWHAAAAKAVEAYERIAR